MTLPSTASPSGPPQLSARRHFFSAITATTSAAICGVAIFLTGCATTSPPADTTTNPIAATEIAAITLSPLALAESRKEFQEVVIPVESDLWARVRAGFTMPAIDSPLVAQQEIWYQTRPDYMRRFVERGARYLYHIVEEVERRGLPTEIVLLPIIESAFNPQAYSRAHASGMWQFIPSTGKNFGLAQDWMTDNRRDVLLSTNAALDYLTKLYGMFNSWDLAFAAYNCGEGCVGRAIQRNQRLGLPTDFVNLKLPNETKAYVPKLLAVKNIILSPDSFGIFLPPVNNRPYFTQVKAPEQIDVKLAARLAEMTEESFAQLNPSFNKPVAATGTGFFLVPFEQADIFRTNLDLYRSLNGPLVSWTTVTAARGQTVDAVARKHGMTASYLRATNGPFKERKGKFTQPATFMAPNAKDAAAITAAFDRKVALKREQQIAIAAEVPSVAPALGDDGPLVRSMLPRATRDNLLLATTAAAVVAIAVPIPTPSTYVVKQGDTLFSIAKRSDITLDALKTTNKLTSNAVNVGQILLIPASDNAVGNMVASNARPPNNEPPMLARVSSVPSTASATRPASSADIANRAKPISVARIHTVRSGDTLYSIAKRFNTSIDNLLALNKLSKRSALKVGARITVSR